MYISQITINNYRSFQSTTIDFHEGINLLIGQNNVGKSNLLRAMRIIFDNSIKKQLTVDDFYNDISLEDLKKEPPKIVISIVLSQSENENLMGDDLVTVSDWLTTLKEPYQAQIQYEYFLPDSEKEHYINEVKYIDSRKEIWDSIKSNFIRLYVHKIWTGNPNNQVTVDLEKLSKFDFQFLDAIRDVERDMFSGKNTLLKDVIDFFMDYEIKSDTTIKKEQQKEQIQNRREAFSKTAQELIEKLKLRLKQGNKEILSYADEIGALFDKSNPSFAGKLTENEIYSILQLIVTQETGMSIPISNNGLGYNNLIFMSLLLAKMQVDSDGKYLGSNAKVFPILAIEEPEAHLHPTMQYQFIKFLKANLKNKKVKQVFITSHSTHIATTTTLDDIICFYKNNSKLQVSYPGKTFTSNNDTNKKIVKEKSKKYVQRFFDATKSNMLFSEKIILVEGIAEQLLLPVFAEYLGLSLEKKHVTVINVGGRYFQHFLYLFDSNNTYALNRKVACITDVDPTRQENPTEKIKNKFKRCYPYEYNLNPEKYTYKYNDSIDKYGNEEHPNIKLFTQSKKYGKTLEYQIAFENPSSEILITESITNSEELTKLMDLFRKLHPLSKLIETLSNSKENDRIKESLKNSKLKWNEDEKKKALIASRYLNSVGKGENALELASALKDNLELKDKEFAVPTYIANAIEWVCK